MKAVILFPGQGAQKVGMGKDLYDTCPAAREMMDQADAALGFELTKVMFEGPDAELTRTCYCQPALYLHGLALYKELCSRIDIEPVAAAGLSLGEFTAHAAAGTFCMEEGLKLVQKRGAYMEEACQAAPSTMAAMIGGNDEAVQALAAECDIDVANYNCPGQTVVSGSVEGVDKAVAGAYHSRFMKSAQEKLLPELEAVNMQMPAVPVYCNYEARPVKDTADVRAMLGAQVCGSVRWAACMQDLVDKGERLFIEMGPGKTLAGMMGRICKDATVISIEDVASLEAAVETLKNM